MSSVGYFELMGFGPNGWGMVMLQATGITFMLSICGFLLGSIFAVLAAVTKLGKSSTLSLISNSYINIVRGLPELVLIYIVFFETGTILTAITGFFGHEEPVFMPAFAVGVLALAIICGAYLAEVFRAAYQSIHKGELEAARSVGMSPHLMFRRIIVPQVLRYALPGIGNIWQFILKESALVSVVGITEIMRQTKVGAGSTKQPFSFYITAALLFILITTLSGFLFRWLEKRTSRGIRRA